MDGDRASHRASGGTTRTMASLFAKMCPGSQEALEVAAKALLHAQLGCALLGTVGWQGTGYCAATVALSAFGIAAIETKNKAMLKVRRGGVGRGRDAMGREGGDR